MTAKKIFPASRRQKDARIAQIFILNSATHLKIHTYSQCGRQKVHLYTHGRHFWTYVNKDERGFYALTASQFCCFVMQVQTGTRTFVPVLPLCSLQSVKARVEEESCPPQVDPHPERLVPVPPQLPGHPSAGVWKVERVAGQSSGVVFITFFLRTETRS